MIAIIGNHFYFYLNNYPLRPFRYISIITLILSFALIIAHIEWQLSLWWFVILLVLYVHSLVLGSIYINWNFYLVSRNKGTHKKFVALSFDDGPGKETEAILDILKDYGINAAFFNIGKNVTADERLVKRMDEEGHLIGNHSYNHGVNFDWKSARKMKQELRETNNAIKNIIGKTPKLFRPPYGVTNPNLAKAVKQLGMISVAWSIRSFDTTAKDPKQLLARILNKIKGGDIILLHDTIAITREILPQLITETTKKGFTFVRIDQLLDIQPYE